ncbi:hypothetical protein AcV7_010110 [Taiwanofungus camphoratus]|nr:hypothetical protein AcV7_010110 [Antrodia cinnamomea]
MRAELPIVSFVCAVLLMGLVPAHWTSRTVALPSLMVWLFTCNIIQGVNTVIWARSTAVQIPAWCDIATKILLGARVALPASCLCLCRHFLNRSPWPDAKAMRRALQFDCMLCIILPVIYMILHVIVQDRRFDLAPDFGCQASIYMSVLAIILLWLPPFVLCIITFVYSCLGILCHVNLGLAFPGMSLRNSAGLTTSTFLRSLLTSLIIVSLITCSLAYSLHARIVSSQGLQRWTSWSAVHARLSTVDVVTQDARSDRMRIALNWWIIPASAFVVISASLTHLACGDQDEAWKGYRVIIGWLRSKILRQRPPGSFLDTSSDPRPHILLKSPTTPTPVHLLKCGWDDTLRAKAAGKLDSIPVSIIIPGDVPASPPASSASDDSEQTFAQSTLTYVESPTGREALGLPPLLPSIQRMNRPAPLPVNAASSITIISHPDVEHASSPKSPGSPPHSLLSEPWPRPPSGIPVSPIAPITIQPPTPEPTYPRSRSPSVSSLSTSLASSTVSAHAYAREPGHTLHDSPTLPHFAPFSDAGIPAREGQGQSSTLTVPERARRMRSKDRLVTRNLSLSLRARGRVREEEDGFGAIYMTVVKETV